MLLAGILLTSGHEISCLASHAAPAVQYSPGVMWALTAAFLVGLIWGVTNPFIKIGSVCVASRQQQGPGLRTWLTASLVVPWLLNQAGSLLFVVLLASSDISKAVPIANAVSVAANAVTDLCLGERYSLQYLIPGCLLVASGVMLCLS